MTDRSLLGNLSPIDLYLNLEEKVEAVAAATKVILPPLPEEDGDYTLTLAIEDGEAGLVWEEAT